MVFTEAVVSDLARTWVLLHRSAAQRHLEYMIACMREDGDLDGSINYSRVLMSVSAVATQATFHGPQRSG